MDQPRKGTIVKCISITEATPDITIGKIYVVRRTYAKHIRILDDIGKSRVYKTRRFELIVEG